MNLGIYALYYLNFILLIQFSQIELILSKKFQSWNRLEIERALRPYFF